MRDGIHHATVQQAHRGLVEVRVHRHPVAAVGVLEQRALAILLVTLAVDQRHRHLHAITCGDPDTLGFILRSVIADHRLLLQLATLASLRIEFIHRGRGGHRGIGIPQPRRIGFSVVAQAHRIRRFIGLHVVGAAVLEQQTDALQAFGTLGDGTEAIEQLEAFDVDRRIMRDPVLPLAARGRVARRGDQLEILRSVIGADHPASVEMIGVILHVALARCQHGEAFRVAGGCVTFLGGHRAVQADGDEAIVAGAANAHVETVVVFFVDNRIGTGRRAQHMLLHAHGEQRLRIVFHIQHGAVVVGPHHVPGRAGEDIGQHLPAAQVLEADDVLATTHIIIGPGQQLVVLADLHRANAEIALAGRHLVHVQQDFLGRLHVALATCVDRVILAGLVTGVIPISPFACRHAGIVLLDARDDFLVQRVLQRFQRRKHLVGIRVFGLQIGQHRLVLALVIAQPVIIIVAGSTKRRLDHVRTLFDIRRDGRSCSGGGGGGHQARKQQAEGRFHEIGLQARECNGFPAPESGRWPACRQPCRWSHLGNVPESTPVEAPPVAADPRFP